MSHKYDSEVDTQREYFNTAYFNTTGTDQLAKYETTLLKPFFNNPDKWKLAINRARVPLNGIPLTGNNIPFEQWGVALYYQTDNTGTGKHLSEAFVPQYNPNTKTGNATYNINTNLEMEIVLGYPTSFDVVKTFPTLNTTITNSLGQKITPIMAVVGTRVFGYFLSSASDTQILVYDMQNGNLHFTLQTNQIIQAIACDSAGNLYTAYQLSSPNSFWIQQYNADVTFNYTYLGQVSAAYPGVPSTYLYWNAIMAIGVGSVMGAIQCTNASGINFSASEYYSGLIVDNGLPQNTAINENFGPGPNYLHGLQMYGTTIVTMINCNGNNLFFTTQSTLTDSFFPQNVTGPNFNNFCGADGVNFQFSGTSTANNAGIPYYGYFIFTGTGEGGLTPVTQVTGIFPPNGSYYLAPTTISYSIIEDAGAYNIYSFQQYLTQINLAFQTVFTALLASIPGISPTEPPSISYNGATKLFSLNCEGAYLKTNTDGSPQVQILLNNNLYQKFLFPSQQFLDPYPYNPLIGLYYTVLLDNYGFNAVIGTGSSTTPQFLYMQQEQSTIYALNDLTRIIIGTTQIPVSGDGEGTLFTNSGATNNRSLNMITDFIPDTTVITNAEPIIYVPQGILRWYNMYAQQPFTKIDLIFYYETKDGLVRPVIITNGEYFSCKLEFKRGPGDF